MELSLPWGLSSQSRRAAEPQAGLQACHAAPSGLHLARLNHFHFPSRLGEHLNLQASLLSITHDAVSEVPPPGFQRGQARAPNLWALDTFCTPGLTPGRSGSGWARVGQGRCLGPLSASSHRTPVPRAPAPSPHHLQLNPLLGLAHSPLQGPQQLL